MIDKRYIGDGVYADVDRGMIKLTAENGLCATDTIYLEPEVFEALQQFYRDALHAAMEERDARTSQ